MHQTFTNIATGNLAFLGEFFVPDSAEKHFKSAEFLGPGRYGVVVRLTKSIKGSASEPSLAVKKMTKPFENAKRAQRCFRELQLLSELSHENIVNILGAYTTDESKDTLENVYLVMDYCGVDLNKVLEREKEERHLLDFKVIQRLTSELLRAIKYLNSAGVIHRDIKPENVAIDGNLKLTLLDFGFARVIDENRQMTRDPGSSLHRAIETISFSGGEKAVYTEKVDIWAVGAILCEMLIGLPIFEHKHPLIKAVELCGPIPENVLNNVDEEQSRKFLQNRSEKAVRVDFVEYLTQKGRSWLSEDIKEAGGQLRNFVDHALVFDQDLRMTVEEALRHPFLVSVREIRREHLASHKVQDVKEKTVEEWKELVWDIVQSSPNGI